MHRDRARRYATVEALMRDIDHYQHGQPLDARPDSFRYRAGKFVTRNRGGLAAAVGALAVLAGLVVFYTGFAWPRPPRRCAHPSRAPTIYRTVHGGDNHHMVATALANLGDVYLERKQLADAERLFRQAIAIHVATLSAEHPSTAIDRIRLGRALLRQRRDAEAKDETLAGYEILRKQVIPTMSWLQKAREDLVTESESLNQQEQAKKFRAEILSAK